MTLARFAQGAYTGNDVEGYQIDEAESNSNYTVYVNHKTKRAVLAYSGTRLHNISDLHMDYKILTGGLRDTKRHKNAMKAAERFHRKYTTHGYKSAITGHSLGGRMALEATSHLHHQKKRGTVTEVFNPFTVGGDSFGDQALQSALIRYHPQDPAYTPIDPNHGHQITTGTTPLKDPKTWTSGSGPDPRKNPVTTQPSYGAPVQFGAQAHHAGSINVEKVTDHPKYKDPYAEQHFKNRVDEAKWLAEGDHGKLYRQHQEIVEREHIAQYGHPIYTDPDWTPIKGAFWNLAPKNVQAALNEFDKQHPWLVSAAETVAAAIPVVLTGGEAGAGEGEIVGGRVNPELAPETQPLLEPEPAESPVATEPVDEMQQAGIEMTDQTGPPRPRYDNEGNLAPGLDVTDLTPEEYTDYLNRLDPGYEPPLRGRVRMHETEPSMPRAGIHERIRGRLRQGMEYHQRLRRFMADPAEYLIREARTPAGRRSIYETTRIHFGERRAQQLHKALSIGSKILVNKAFVHETLHTTAHTYDKYHDKLDRYFQALEAHRLHRYL